MNDLIRRKDVLNATKMVYIECIYVDEEGYEETEMDNRDVVFKSDILALPVVDAVEIEAIRAWLYKIAMNNTNNYLCDACEEIISRLEGLRVFARERKAG